MPQETVLHFQYLYKKSAPHKHPNITTMSTMNPHVITPLIRSSVALLLLGLSALLSSLQAQTPTDSLRSDGGWEAFIESQLQVGLLTEEEAHEAAALYDELRRAPLDINSVREEELRRLPMLSDYQIYQFVRYRTDHQAFHELSELKLVPGWSLSLIALLRPVIVCRPIAEERPLLGNTLEATHEARVFYGKRSSTGFASKKPLLGSEDALRLSYSYATPHSLSLFIAGEKDYGEPWRRGAHRGFDAYSLHAQLEHRALTLVLGDYRVARGSGLILSQGAFPLSFLSLTLRQGTGVRPVRSMTESDFSRGAAGMLSLGSYRLGLFASHRRIDAHRSDEGFLTALSETGLHTTEPAWEARRQALTRLYGGWIEYRVPDLELSLQGMYQDWQGDRLRHPPGTQGDATLEGLRSYTAWSFSYRYQALRGHLRLSGEAAYTSRSAWAFIQHLSYLQGGWADFRLSLWHIGAHYWTYYGRAGTHALRPHSEDGGRLQLQLTPFSSLGSTLLYLDAYRAYSQRSGDNVARSAVSYGLMTSLQIEREASLRLHYRGRKDSHRFKLEGIYDRGAWQPRLALLYARGAASSGWAVQGRLRWAPSERLHLDLLADAFDAPSWDSRLYTLTPMLRGEYGATLLYGKGAVLGGRVRYRLSSHWLLEGRVQHEHQQRDVRPTKTLFALSLRYRGW